MPQVGRDIKIFPTGSSYEGSWDILGMSGFGTYIFPDKDVIYKGHFRDGMFHGRGELIYENGTVIRGEWRNGTNIRKELVFDDELQYEEKDWKYCNMPDRRYTCEHKEGLRPGGCSNMTAKRPTLTVPPDYYDIACGFFDPNTEMIYDDQDLTKIVRAPGQSEVMWIKHNCRKSPDESVGPIPSLYEEWKVPKTEGEVAPPTTCSLYEQQQFDDDSVEDANGLYDFYNPSINSRIAESACCEDSNPKFTPPAPGFAGAETKRVSLMSAGKAIKYAAPIGGAPSEGSASLLGLCPRDDTSCTSSRPVLPQRIAPRKQSHQSFHSHPSQLSHFAF